MYMKIQIERQVVPTYAMYLMAPDGLRILEGNTHIGSSLL
jgi:hypothetical protein